MLRKKETCLGIGQIYGNLIGNEQGYGLKNMEYDFKNMEYDFKNMKNDFEDIECT